MRSSSGDYPIKRIWVVGSEKNLDGASSGFPFRTAKATRRPRSLFSPGLRVVSQHEVNLHPLLCQQGVPTSHQVVVDERFQVMTYRPDVISSGLSAGELDPRQQQVEINLQILQGLTLCSDPLLFELAMNADGTGYTAIVQLKLNTITSRNALEVYASFYALLEAIEFIFAGDEHKPTFCYLEKREFLGVVPNIDQIDSDILRKLVERVEQFRCLTHASQFQVRRRLVLLPNSMPSAVTLPLGFLGVPTSCGQPIAGTTKMFDLRSRLAYLRGWGGVSMANYQRWRECGGDWLRQQMPESSAPPMCIKKCSDTTESVLEAMAALPDTSDALCLCLTMPYRMREKIMAKELAITGVHNHFLLRLDQDLAGVAMVRHHGATDQLRINFLKADAIDDAKVLAIVEKLKDLGGEFDENRLCLPGYLKISEGRIKSAIDAMDNPDVLESPALRLGA